MVGKMLFELLRIVLGSIYVLFLPGFVWSYVFFKKGEIDEMERIALSFGLSIALVPLVVFWLNWLFKVRINLVNIVLIIAVITFFPLIYLKIRKK